MKIVVVQAPKALRGLLAAIFKVRSHRKERSLI